MREEERRRLGILVRQHRERRGLSQLALAHLVGVSDRWVMDLELGRVDPRLGVLEQLETALGVDLVQLSGSMGGQETDDVKRRAFLATLAATSAGMIDLERLAAPSADRAWLEEADSLSAALAGQREAVAPATLLPAVLGHVDGLSVRLPGATAVYARAALLAGILLQLAGQNGRGFQLHSLAAAVGDTTVRAKATGGLARGWELAGDLPRAIRTQSAAISMLGRGTPRLRGALTARRAELRADAGDDRGALLDLDAAETAMAASGYEWHYFNPAEPDELAAYRGATLAKLGRHGEAVEAFDWVLARMAADKVLWRAHVAEDRDRALAAL